LKSFKHIYTFIVVDVLCKLFAKLMTAWSNPFVKAFLLPLCVRRVPLLHPV